MALQLTTSDVQLYRVGLYGLYNLGLEQEVAMYQDLIGGTIKSKQAYEVMKFHAGLGLFKQRYEGENVTIDDVPQRFEYTMRPMIFSLGIEWTKQAEYKDMYHFISAQAPLLAQSAMATNNLNAANAFVNFAFPGGSSIGPDSKTIYATDHSTAGTTVQSNYGTESISYFAIANILTSVLNQKLDRDNLPRHVKGGYKLWCGNNNAEAANRILNSMNVASTNLNDTSKWARDQIKDIVVNPYIGYEMTSTANAWGIIPASASENPFRKLEIEGTRVESDYIVGNDTFLMVTHFENAYLPMGWAGTAANKP